MAVKGKKAAANTAKTTVKNQQCYKAAAKTKATEKNQKATSKTKRAVGALELSASRGEGGAIPAPGGSTRGSGPPAQQAEGWGGKLPGRPGPG